MTNRDKQRLIRRKQELRKRKRKMRIFFCGELLCVFCFVSFFIGKAVGTKEEQKNVAVSKVVTQKEGAVTAGNDRADMQSGQVSAKLDKSNIILVNKENKLPEDYEVELKVLPDGVNRAAYEAYEPLCDMLKAGQREGLSFEICSSYRDVKRQEELFEEDLKALVNKGYTYLQAYEEVAKETMPPGYSEHSTGLAFDIVALNYQMLDDGQAKTAENKWLQEHCAEYGFILRYPEDKEDITGISYESWHFRYVGQEVAEYIMEEGITLEEYLNTLTR